MDYSNAIERIDLANARITQTKLKLFVPSPGPPERDVVLPRKAHRPYAGNIFHYMPKKLKSYPKSKFSK